MPSLLIRNGKVYRRGVFEELSVFIENGQISKISKRIDIQADGVIDAQGKLVIPGVIDAHVHFRDPGLTWKEDFYTGSCAAASGGVTTVLDMPNTKPKTNTIESYIEKVRIGESKSIVDFGLHAGVPLSRKDLVEMHSQGARTFKVYTYEYSEPLKVLQKIATWLCEENLPGKILIHAESKKVIEKNTRRLSESEKNIWYHEQVRGPEAEEIEVKKILKFIAKNGCFKSNKLGIHFVHISTRNAARSILEAKNKDLNVTFEVTPHHLILKIEDVDRLGPIVKVNPPLRNHENVEYLQTNLEHIDLFTSDHAPHTALEKLYGLFDITRAPSGIIGVETMLPLLLTHAQNRGRSLSAILDKLTREPAEIFNIKEKGRIEEGYHGDIVILDPKKEWEIRGENLHGKTKFTPFEGFKVNFKVDYTILRGELIYEKGECIGKKGYGRFIGDKSATRGTNG